MRVKVFVQNMTYFLKFIIVLSMLAVSLVAQPEEDTTGINYRYRQNYDFITMKDTIFTFDSEFILPDGYRHADSTELSPYQNYVANFPLWHRHLPIGNWKGAKELDKTEISRPVHLPHQGLAFTNKGIPVRILAEYLHDNNRELELEIAPINGDRLKYTKWLFNKVVYGARKTVKYREVPPRDTTLNTYYAFMKTCMRSGNFQSLTYNGDAVALSDLMPGDIFVAYNENSTKGEVFVVMHMLVAKKKDDLYAVATGCKKPCDFHIPLFNGDRDNPWLTANEIYELGDDYPNRGFYRFKIK